MNLAPPTGKDSTVFVSDLIKAITRVVGNRRVALHEPSFSGNEWIYLKECLDSTYVSSVGKFVDRFEADLAKYTGAKHVIAVVNGTAALHIALMLAGVVSDDEVLVPTLTFIATPNAVAYCKATPHFVDSEVQTLGIDPYSLRDYLLSITEQRGGVCVNKKTGKIIRAIVPMHTFGHPAKLDQLVAIARDFNLALVEDAAESLGSFYNGQHTGTFGKLGTLSFNGNKTITTGGGGAILTNDSELARQAKHITTTAKVGHRWAFNHDEVGYNYRLPNLNAALGCAQLEKLPELIAAKRTLRARYADAFAAIPEVQIMHEPPKTISNYWLQTLLLDDSISSQRDQILDATNDAGLMTRPIWTLMHLLPPYQHCPRGPLTVAESLQNRIINLPSSAFL